MAATKWRSGEEEAMELTDLTTKLQQVVNGRIIFGEPYERNGTTVIPAARVRAGAGGGEGGATPENRGVGGGGGLVATPVGAWVVTPNDVRWQPAIDVGGIVRSATVLGIAALLTVRSFRKRR